MMQAYWAVLSAGFTQVNDTQHGEEVRAIAGDVQLGVYPRRGGGYWMVIQHAGQRAEYVVAANEYDVRLHAVAALDGWTVNV